MSVKNKHSPKKRTKPARRAKTERANRSEEHRARHEINRKNPVLRNVFDKLGARRRRLKQDGFNSTYIELDRIASETEDLDLKKALAAIEKLGLHKDDWQAELNRRPPKNKFDKRVEWRIKSLLRFFVKFGFSREEAAEATAGITGVGFSFDQTVEDFRGVISDDELLQSKKGDTRSWKKQANTRHFVSTDGGDEELMLPELVFRLFDGRRLSSDELLLVKMQLSFLEAAGHRFSLDKLRIENLQGKEDS